MPVPLETRKDMRFHLRAAKFHLDRMHPDKLPPDAIPAYSAMMKMAVEMEAPLERFIEKAENETLRSLENPEPSCPLHGALAEDGRCDVCEGRGLWAGIEKTATAGESDEQS